MKETTSNVDNPAFSAVLLAAGMGRRAGGFKPLWKIGEETVLDRVIRAASATCSHIRIVGGYAFDRLRLHVDGLKDDRLELVFNPNWQSGMFSSIQVGLYRLQTPVFIHPVDIFAVSSKIYVRMAAQVVDLHSRPVIRPRFGDRTGHPILLMPWVIHTIQKNSGQTNLREILRDIHPKYDIQVDDDSILKDCDTPADFEKLKTRIINYKKQRSTS